MGFFSRAKGGGVTEVVPAITPSAAVESDGLSVFLEAYSNAIELRSSLNTTWTFLSAVKRVSVERNRALQEVRDMEQDALVGSALEMMADDATQPDELGRSFWPVSTDKELQTMLEQLFEYLDINSRVWSWAYQVARDGELFIRTYEERRKKKSEQAKPIAPRQPNGAPEEPDVPSGVQAAKKKARDIQTLTGNGQGEKPVEPKSIDLSDFIFEEVEDPSGLFALIEYGQDVGYFEVQTMKTPSAQRRDADHDGPRDGVLFAPSEFIHICNEQIFRRQQVNLRVQRNMKPDGRPDEGDDRRLIKIKIGTSFIDKARRAFRILSLLEDILIMSRINRSSVIRLVNVEVGTADRVETLKMLQTVKSRFTSRERLSLAKEKYQIDRSPVPLEDYIYIPTRNQVGEVQVNEVGGSLDVKSIVDIDDFRNKLFAALKIPKQYLSFDDEVPGQAGNTSLTRLDIRYARTIKRLKRLIHRGLERLVNYFLTEVGMAEDIGRWELKSVRISDAEETDKVADIATRSVSVEAIMGVLNNERIQAQVDPRKLVTFLFAEILGVDADKFLMSEAEAAKQATSLQSPEGGEGVPGGTGDEYDLSMFDGDLGQSVGSASA